MIQTSQQELSLLDGMNYFGDPSLFICSSSTQSNVIEAVQCEVNTNLVLQFQIGPLRIIGHTNFSGKAARSFRFCLCPDLISKSHLLITLVT